MTTDCVSDLIGSRRAIVSRNSCPSGVSRAPGKTSHRLRPDHVARLAAEMARRLAVEAPDAPLAIDGVETLADPLEDGGELGLDVGASV